MFEVQPAGTSAVELSAEHYRPLGLAITFAFAGMVRSNRNSTDSFLIIGDGVKTGHAFLVTASV